MLATLYPPLNATVTGAYRNIYHGFVALFNIGGPHLSHYMTALAMKQKGLKPATKIVLYWIADHHNGEDGRCFPSLARLCECTEMGKTALTGHLNALEELGLIERVRTKKDDGGWTSTSYILHLEEPLVRKTNNPCSEMTTPLVRNANTNLVSNNLGREPNILVDHFDEFWACVPKKVGKGQAVKAWKTALKKADAFTIINAMRSYAQQREGQDAQFTAHPATWLNGERWADEAQPSTSHFYDNVQKHLNGANDELQRADQISGINHHGLPAAISAPKPSRQRGSTEGDFSDSGRGQRAYLNLVKPRRF